MPRIDPCNSPARNRLVWCGKSAEGTFIQFKQFTSNVNILLCNVGYLLNNRDFLGGYLPRPRGAILGNPAGELSATEDIVDIIVEHKPDAVGLVEVDQGSFRTITDGQVAMIRQLLTEKGMDYHGTIFGKYGPHTMTGRLPFFSHLGNAILLKNPEKAVPRYLTTGMKRLVIEAPLTDQYTLLLAHLSVRARSRRQQLRELASLINEEYAGEKVILAGDFNTYLGRQEFEEFIDQTGFSISIPGKTLHSRPFDELLLETRSIDLFLTSPTVEVDHSEVVAPPIADHRPALLTINT